MKINVKHQYKDQIWYEVEDAPEKAKKASREDDGRKSTGNSESPSPQRKTTQASRR